MKKILIFSLLILVSIFMFMQFNASNTTTKPQVSSDEFAVARQEQSDLDQAAGLVKATFAGGCFWCLEGPLESIAGVQGVLLGYMGGTVENPTYQQISSGTTGHKEVAQAYYDPTVTNYYDLIDIYWKFIDPTDAGGQFADRGSQYRIGIYYHTEEQKEIAEQYIQEQETSGKYDKPIVVEVLPATDFYLAEDYHQDYYKKQSGQYKNYYKGSGREAYVESNE
jgi:methionine-S-sulfoxide reductase